MARKPSCVNHGVSVDIVCFAQRSSTDVASIMISVAMHVHPDRRPGDVYWEEADAWAQAVAGSDRYGVEPRGGLEKPGSRIFHYALTAGEPATGAYRLGFPAVRQRTAQPWMPEVWPKRILAAPSQ